MNDFKVSFISCKGRNFTEQMSAIKQYFLQHIEGCRFDYFMKNMSTLKGNRLETIKNAFIEYLSFANHIVLVDGSLDVKGVDIPRTNVVMLVEPYDYLFKALYDWKINKFGVAESKLSDYCKNFIASSALINELLEKGYVKADSTIINRGSMLATMLLDKELQQQKKADFCRKFNEDNDKNIVAVLTKNSETDLPVEIEIEELLDALPSNQIIVTNNQGIFSQFNRLNESDREKVVYIDKSNNFFDVLYFADVLYTDYSYWACYFAGTKKECYILKNPGLWFCNYIEKKYPKLYVETSQDMVDMMLGKLDVGKQREKFVMDLAIMADDRVGECVYELLGGK
jgi:hypothetical protein